MFSTNRTAPVPPSPLQPQVLQMSAWDPETSFAPPGHVVRPPVHHARSHEATGDRRNDDSLLASVHSEVLSNDLIQRPANAWLRRYFGSTWATDGGVTEGFTFIPALDLGPDMNPSIDRDRRASMDSVLSLSQTPGIHNRTYDTLYHSSNVDVVRRFFQTRPMSPASSSPTETAVDTPRLHLRARKRVQKKYRSIKHGYAKPANLPIQSTLTSNGSSDGSKTKTYHASFPTSFPTFSTRDTSHMEFTIGETSPLHVDTTRFPTPPLQSQRALDNGAEIGTSVAPGTTLASSPPSSSGNDVHDSVPNYTDVAKLVLPLSESPFGIATPPVINSTPMLRSSFTIPLQCSSPISDHGSNLIDARKKPPELESRFPLRPSTQYSEKLPFNGSNPNRTSSLQKPRGQAVAPPTSTSPIQGSKVRRLPKAQPARTGEATTTTTAAAATKSTPNNNKKLPKTPDEPSTHAPSKPRVWVQHPALATKQRPLHATPSPYSRPRPSISAYPTPTNSSSPSAPGTDTISEKPQDPPLASTTTRRQSYKPPAQIRLPIRRISYPASPPPTQPLPSNVIPFNPSFASLSPFSPLKLKASVYAPTASAMDARHDSMGIGLASPRNTLQQGEDGEDEGSRRGRARKKQSEMSVMTTYSGTGTARESSGASGRT